MSVKHHPRTALGRIVHNIEETGIALILGCMTVVTFINVVLRYGFNSQILWGLEVTLVLFAWLILFGVSYAFKITAHLGVDALLAAVSSRPRRVMTLVSAAVCVAYGMLMMKGAWDYWAPFAGLDATEGRWFPTGFANSRDQAWYETEQIPIPFLKGWLEATFNAGEEYEKMPRFIPYVMLPFGVALMLYRVCEVSLRIIRGSGESLIVAHEAEHAVDGVGEETDGTSANPAGRKEA